MRLLGLEGQTHPLEDLDGPRRARRLGFENERRDPPEIEGRQRSQEVVPWQPPLVVRHGEAAQVLEAARKRADLEEQKRLRLAAGELGLDIYEMRPRLAAKGLRYVDSLDELGG